ncbi:MAG: hypothetical protein L3J89_06305 [Gammaproteobacteria bacterium]|nr:hypothetical protein [Gammaproteobacteria bacterium]
MKINHNLIGRVVTALMLSAVLSACGGSSSSEEEPPKLAFDEEPPKLVLQPLSIQVAEGNSGTTVASFNIILSASSASTVTVDYATSDISATAPDDYQSVNGTLSFPPGETSKVVMVNVVGDAIAEPDETFRLTLSNPGNADLGSAVGVATITTDDEVAILPIPALQIGNINLAEGNSGTTTAEFSITLSASSTSTVTVDYATSDITATAPGDYQSKNATLSFAPGETSKTVMINVITDVIAELDETFKLTLSNPGNADLSDAVGVATIINDDTDSTVLLSNPGPQFFDEEQAYTINITARPNARIFVSGMPPGMHWDEVNRRFDFRPDFIQGGKSWQVTMEAVDGIETQTQTFEVRVNNTIQPPWPVVVSVEEISGATQALGIFKLGVEQTTDDFLDSPGHAGRVFQANLAIPKPASAANLLPVRIGLHGSGGSPGTVGRGWIFGVAPHDPHRPTETWWTGYNNQLPDGEISNGSNPDYTQRRVMHLLSFLLENCPGWRTEGCPGADLERISVSGQSMGGTGSHFLAINYARHFAEVSSRIGGTTPHFLSNGQQGTLASIWGSKAAGLPDEQGRNVWEHYDASRAALNDKDFRNLHFSTISGKNDPTISFNAMVGVSPVTATSFIGALQQEGIGHLVVWDQRAHGGSDPLLGATWWQKTIQSPPDENFFLRRNRAFPAFSNSSTDDDSGAPDGMGGFTGTLRGAKNRYLQWDNVNIIDTRDQLSVPIKVDIDTTGTPPADPSLPPQGNKYYGSLPITADATIRRIQQFQLLPGETVRWSYAGNSGTVSANNDGSVTVPNLEMLTSFTPLVLTRP